MNKSSIATLAMSNESDAPPARWRAKAVRDVVKNKISDRHHERLAVVYIRQSTRQQVIENEESRLRQYELADRAVELGWPRHRVLVIDEDQGQTGRMADHRSGFQRLLTEVTLEHVGLVLGLEMSRLSRSSKDWHHLLELCALFGTLLGDQDGIYDPLDSNDRLLLGLKGTMSEFELFTMRNRLQRGLQHKAERGELFIAVPVGYLRLPSGDVIQEPDEQAQSVVRLIFAKFEEIGTAFGVLRYLARQGVRIGIRLQKGPRAGELDWRRPTMNLISRVLRHPIYAGAYVFGRNKTWQKSVDGTLVSKQRRLPRSEWKVLKRDVLPAYISWEQYEENLQRMRANKLGCSSPGSVRNGQALLSGIVVCGVCGRRFNCGYKHSNRPYYVCNRDCEEVRQRFCSGLAAPAIDQLIVRQVLKALEPAVLQLSVQAVDDEQRERERLHSHWNKRLERARFEVDRAERQYQKVEPENRLVARTLERNWEEALGKLREVEEEVRRFSQSTPERLSDEERARIQSLAQDIPALWNSPATSNADRKEIIRGLIERVVANVTRESASVDVVVHWQGGFVSRHELLRPMKSYQGTATGEQIRERVTQLRQAGCTAKQIAEQFTQENILPPRRCNPYSTVQIWQLLQRYGLTKKLDAVQLAPDEWKLSALAKHLNVPILRLRNWSSKGWVHARQTPTQGLWIAWADADDLDRLRRLAAASKHGVSRHSLELTTPKPKP
jgi:DNA invertase Pin-like site-specific DNA recombinase